jgi:hypothetical protein
MRAGSWQKIEEMQRRAMAGEPLFQENDIQMTATIEEQEIATQNVISSQNSKKNQPNKNNPKKNYFRLAM